MRAPNACASRTARRRRVSPPTKPGPTWKGAVSLRAADWQRRRRSEDTALCTARDDADRARQAAARAVEDARTVLGAARAAREAVERHHEAWQEEQRRHAERRAEAEAEDVQAGRRGRSA
jgi:hypothetical protein